MRFGRLSRSRALVLGIFALMVVAVVFATPAAAQTPSGPVYHAASDTYYQLVLRPVPFESAAVAASQARFNGRVGRLAEPKSYSRDAFITATWGRQLERCWVGGVRPRSSLIRPWTWASNGEAFSYTNWAKGQPDNAAGKEDRLVYWPGSLNGMSWNDLSKNDTKARGYVIEFPRRR